MAIEFDDAGLRVIGNNVKGIAFYDDNRVLRQTIYLKTDNTLNIGGSGGGGVTVETALTPHELSGSIHNGTLAPAQFPTALLTTGARSLTGQLTSTVATGTAPFVVASTTQVTNLNSDKLDGYDAAAFPRKAENATIAGQWTVQDTLTTRDLLPEATDSYDLGSTTKLWRKGYLSELETVLFALNTVTISGNRQVWGHNAGTLGTDLASGDTTCDFGQAMTVGDFVEMRGFLQVEYFQVGTLVSGTTYRIGASGSGARNLDGSGANSWPAGTPYLVLGASGDGRVEIDASGPRLSILVQGATYNANTEYVSIGNLRNRFGIGSNDYYGIGLGDYAGGNYLKYDHSGGFALKAGGADVVIDANGVSILDSGALRLIDGANQFSLYANGAGLYLDALQSSSFLIGSSSGGSWGSTYTSYAAIASAYSRFNGLKVTSSGIAIGNPTTGELFTLGDVRIGGGLYVGDSGAATDPDADDIHYDGNLKSVKGGTAYDVYGFHPLTTPLTSSSWDGDDTISTGTWSWDTSTWGAPAGIKAALVQLSGAWSSASAGKYAALRPKGGSTNVAKISALTTGQQDMTVVVPCDGNGDIDIVVAGASMLNAVMRMWGYWI